LLPKTPKPHNFDLRIFNLYSGCCLLVIQK